MEPVLPQPHLVVIGRSPAVGTLASMAGVLGWRTVVVDDGGFAEDYQGAGRRRHDARPRAGGRERPLDRRRGDAGPLRRGGARGSARDAGPYVGLVASRKRAGRCSATCGTAGCPKRSRVHAPAGLDLGKVAHEEIAVAILAELVRERAAGRSPRRRPPRSPGTRRSTVCGMTVDVADAKYSSAFEGTTYYFCSAGCLHRFEEDPRGSRPPRLNPMSRVRFHP